MVVIGKLSIYEFISYLPYIGGVEVIVGCKRDLLCAGYEYLFEIME